MQPFPVIQRGYGGAKLSDFAWYADRIIFSHQFRALVLFIANDIAGTQEDKTPGEVLRLFKYVIDKVREKYPEVPIFWVEVTPTESRWNVWPKIQEASRLIAGNCSNRERVYFVHTQEAFLGAEGRPEESLFRDDKLHLNRSGYRIWARIIKQALNRQLNMRSVDATP
jgi:lysophospholipase L1-like esterase